MIATDTYGRAVDEHVYSGAAARKMLSVAESMRDVGMRVVIVSLPCLGIDAKRGFYPSRVTREAGVPVVFLMALRSRYLRKMLAPLALLAFCFRYIGRQDAVILYNHSIEYLPALILLRLLGIKVVQDIEDAPADNEKGARGFLNRASFAVTLRLTAPRKMVVARHVAEGLGLKDFVVIHGVASAAGRAGAVEDQSLWEQLKGGGPLRVHFGGTLIPETGVDLFCEAVQQLARLEDKLAREVSFKVTGIGRVDKITGLQRQLKSRKISVELLPELGSAEYASLMKTCHASLSLKRPGASMSNTTFPSKVIEITATGLALVATKVGDVADIFDENSSYLLSSYDADSLVGVIFDMAAHPDRVQAVATRGLMVCSKEFAPETIGLRMTRLL